MMATMSTSPFTAVAWVPDDDPTRPWDEAADPAARWTHAQCVESGATGVLVTNSLGHLSVPILEEFANRHRRTSPRGSSSRVGTGVGPVLSYVPEPKSLAFAMSLARQSALCVVEGSLFPLAGWAAQLGAVNLITGDVTPPLEPAMVELVDHLKFIGNNGFGDDYGKRDARRTLAGTEVDTDVLFGALLAAGIRPNGIRNLERIVDRLVATGRPTSRDW